MRLNICIFALLLSSALAASVPEPKTTTVPAYVIPGMSLSSSAAAGDRLGNIVSIPLSVIATSDDHLEDIRFVVDNVKDAVADVAEKVSDVVSNLREKIADVVKDGKEAVAEILTDVQEKLSEDDLGERRLVQSSREAGMDGRKHGLNVTLDDSKEDDLKDEDSNENGDDDSRSAENVEENISDSKSTERVAVDSSDKDNVEEIARKSNWEENISKHKFNNNKDDSEEHKERNKLSNITRSEYDSAESGENKKDDKDTASTREDTNKYRTSRKKSRVNVKENRKRRKYLRKASKARRLLDNMGSRINGSGGRISDSCPVYPVQINNDQVTIITRDGCSIIIKLRDSRQDDEDEEDAIGNDNKRRQRSFEVSYVTAN